jgi:sterol desaturase/sphingolipid hydroxylase (fatty acid hydroxylase superfamily)
MDFSAEGIKFGGHLAAATALAALWTAESLAPMFAGRAHRASHVANNLGLALLNAGVSLVFASAVVAVTAAASARGFGLVRWVPMPVWLQWACALLLFDCWQYWWHRMNHRLPFLWRFHSVHHADAEMDASTGVRFHTGEIALSFLARMAVLPLIGMTLPQLLLYEAEALPVILFHHSNIRMPARADRALRWLLVTPWMHVVHHSRWQPETDSNYSSLLSVWDRVFGSFRLRDDPATVDLGLSGWSEGEWRRLGGMLGRPFRRRVRAGSAGRSR